MKKIKYRNNNYNNQIYSINYKFDSVSPAGKYTATALDLIKRYNELAKEAHANGNYVEAEVFRQYAEHYRKIVTEINERKNSRFNNQEADPQTSGQNDGEQPQQNPESEKASVAEDAPAQPAEKANETTLVETKPKTHRKSFKVIEISDSEVSAKPSVKQKKAK